MPKTVTPLNNRQIKAAKPKSKEYLLADGQGLGLRVKPNGSKTWLFNYYRPYIKKRAQISFGTYPEVSLLEARKKRASARELLASDIDPKEHKDEIQINKEAEAQNTLEAVALEWLETKSQTVTGQHIQNIKRSLELHVFPQLAPIPLGKLTAQKVISVLKPLESADKLDMLGRLCQRLKEIMNYAVNTGRITNNNLSGISSAFKSAKAEHMATLEPEELPYLIATVNQASLKLITKSLFEWQLHTMTRPAEAAGAKWNEIDFENKVWHIPAERMKKNRPHFVPLTPQSLALLEHIQPLSGHREHLFPSDKDPLSHVSRETLGAALRRIGLKGKQTAHGLRALASTTLNEQGFESDIIEAALAHSDKNQVRAAYNRTDYLERRRKMMRWWSDHIEEASKGSYSVTGRQHLKAI